MSFEQHWLEWGRVSQAAGVGGEKKDTNMSTIINPGVSPGLFNCLKSHTTLNRSGLLVTFEKVPVKGCTLDRRRKWDLKVEGLRYRQGGH